MSKKFYTIGVDVGQEPEPSALAVVETIPAEKEEITPRGNIMLGGVVIAQVEGKPELRDKQELYPRLRCSYIQRLPQRTNYPALARRLLEIETKLLSAGGFTLHDYTRRDKHVQIPEELTIYLDVTDTGKPVADLIQEALQADVISCRFVPGEPDYSERMEWKISKLELITQLKIMVQTGRLEIAGKSKDLEGTRAIREMTAELENFQYKTPARDDTQELKVGARDDMVTALGLAVLGALHRQPLCEPKFYFL